MATIFLRADNNDAYQTGPVPRLIIVFGDHTGHPVGIIVQLQYTGKWASTGDFGTYSYTNSHS